VIQHIELHAILQESVAGFYADLVTRPTGRAVRERIERFLGTLELEPAPIAVIDFTGVGCLDFSCADEIVAKLLRDRVRVLVLRGMTEAHRDAIEPVLETAGLVAFAAAADGALAPIGPGAGADALLEELVARRLAARAPGGAVTLSLA
jgi:hypothetical protein